ncbi:MAG: pirin family protein [Pseudomonadota bacterium]
MQMLRPADDRGKASFGWLDSRHSFSFGHYFDPSFMGYGPLRVINEDRVDPGAGFDTHGHSDMEIISYVLDGALEHRDSIGTGSIIRPGEIQRMTAGTGIRHSEYNASKTDPVHFLQIWIVPERDGLEPSYEQATLPAADTDGGIRLIGSRDGRDGSMTIHQDVDLSLARLNGDQTVTASIAPGRIAWAQVARGSVSINGQGMVAGDGLALKDETSVVMTSGTNAEVLLFDMAI